MIFKKSAVAKLRSFKTHASPHLAAGFSSLGSFLATSAAMSSSIFSACLFYQPKRLAVRFKPAAHTCARLQLHL
jgi:cyclic lactone autoinducer peptide